MGGLYHEVEDYNEDASLSPAGMALAFAAGFVGAGVLTFVILLAVGRQFRDRGQCRKNRQMWVCAAGGTGSLLAGILLVASLS